MFPALYHRVRDDSYHIDSSERGVKELKGRESYLFHREMENETSAILPLISVVSSFEIVFSTSIFLCLISQGCCLADLPFQFLPERTELTKHKTSIQHKDAHKHTQTHKHARTHTDTLTHTQHWPESFSQL